MSTQGDSSSSERSRRMAGLTPERRALLDRLLLDRRPSQPSSTAHAIPRRPPSAIAPMSFAQQRMWLLDQMVPASPYYNETNTFRLRAALDVRALERAVNEIARRHEALRTSFKVVQDRPMQAIASAVHVPMPVVDLRPFPIDQRAREARRRAEQDAALPFDLSRLPLFRTTLLQIDSADYVFVLTMHHIVCDGWSMPVFFNELNAIYDAFTRGLPSPLPELAIQYADFAVWQRERVSGALLEAQLAYWRTQLADLAVLQLPTDRPRPSTPSYAGARQRVRIGGETAAGLAAIAQQEEATLFMTLLAAWSVLLSRYSGQDDVAVGVPIANRTHTALEGLIGFFVNSLVIRARLDGEPTFREVVRRVRQAAFGAYAHQDVPFERIVEDQHPERDTARHPLFQVIFQFFTVPRAVADDSAEELGVELTTAKFDLRLDLYQAVNGFTGFVEYSTDLFDASTIARLIGHYQTLLDAIVADPDQAVTRLPILTEAERQQLLGEWHHAPMAWDGVQTMQERFEAQVARDPMAPAIEFSTLTHGGENGESGDGGGQETWSYAELNRRANTLAHRLLQLGVGPGVLVGVTAERSPHTIVALVAIVKAGGAYVPIDAAWPVERQRFAARDAGVRIALALDTELDALASEDVTIVCADTDDATVADDAGEAIDTGNPDVRTRADDLVYVMPTSGSTGTPKGVCVAQRGVLRMVIDPNYFQLTPSETFLQFAPLPFDASTFEIWGALLNGARVVVFPPGTPSLDELGRVIEASGVTTLWVTASLFRQLVDEQLPRLRGVRQLITGGEVLSVAHVQRMRAAVPSCMLLNAYGPTENTTFTTTFDTSSGSDAGAAAGAGSATSPAAPIPIGKPISGTSLYVCDRHGALVPIGVPGELYIGGVGLARGYWHRDELTAERFVTSPFDANGSERLYRSGDLVRWRPDGLLDFLARLDDQIKLRGFRIEPGEIEAALDDHPAVRESVVVASRDSGNNGDGLLRLVAYVTLREPPQEAPDEATSFSTMLRMHLRQRLPEYMIPSAIVVLDEIPVTASGKADRRSLAARQEIPRERNTPYLAPRTDDEETLARIWMDLLHVERVGVHDNFFELGGHSLLGTQLISRLREAFQIELPFRRLFEAPTIASLAQAIEQERRAPSAILARIVPVSSPLAIDQLSDEEVDAMLQQMLGGEA